MSWHSRHARRGGGGRRAGTTSRHRRRCREATTVESGCRRFLSARGKRLISPLTKVLCHISHTSSRNHMIPPGGQTVMKPHGTNRFTPVFLAALARGIWSCCSAGPTQLITTSIPVNASMSCSSGAFKSHFRIWQPRS